MAGEPAVNEFVKETGATKALRAAVAIAAAAYALMFFGVAALRLGYPYKLEWMEDITLAHVARAASGEGIFGQPAADFTPSFYTPLFYHAATPFLHAGGYQLASIRLFSVILTALILAGVYVWVRKETGSRFHGLCAAGLFAACYRESGAHFDLARIDMMFLALILFVGYVLRFHAHSGRLGGWIAAGVILAVAYFAKQTALVMAVPLAVGGLLADRRGGAAFAASFLIGVAVPHVWLNTASDGWFGFYTVRMLFGQPFRPEGILGFWASDLMPALPFGLAAAAWLLPRWRVTDRPRMIHYLFTGAAFIGAAWTSRAKAGGYINVLIPAHMILAVAFAVGLSEAEKLARGSARPARGVAALYGLALLQFAILIYDPRRLIPTPADRAAGDRLVQRIREIPGPVYAPFHPLYAEMAGKPRMSHALPLLDIERADRGATGKQAWAILTDPVKAHAFAAIVLDDRRWEMTLLIRNEYPGVKPLGNPPGVFYFPSGWRTRPQEIRVPASGERE